MKKYPIKKTNSVVAKKSLGQNFLKSEKALNQIIESAGNLDGQTVLEIGPGMGALTQKIVDSTAKRIVLIEMDMELIKPLEEKFSNEIASGRVQIIHDDILKVKLSDLGIKKGEYKLIANIPYYITGAIIRNIIGGDCYPKSAVILIQKEVAERIVARDKKESILSIAVKSIGTPKIVDTVPSGAFVPSPKVDSAILKIENISKKFFDEDRDQEINFFRILHAGFAHKRKLLKGNLNENIFNGQAREKLIACNIPENSRAENLTVEEWKKLSLV